MVNTLAANTFTVISRDTGVPPSESDKVSDTILVPGSLGALNGIDATPLSIIGTGY